ncbi:TetR/AcrR family transcriptional regulator [Spelaeicoccus albus]|uniref:AcrR family transcriptional regulator n=1 Tax=Spelaeicoccus albus TaxID=1280376 RepID=A0A7Z0IIA4_9MICO|nr:TetR/AcrR family transcriptional regulator [Spelaeicoccus albus]NYI68182.1 AcrR family transcriptional regulator [Spelaeicoccus albus]
MRIPIDDRRAALVAAALRVIARDGVQAASTRAVTAEAGMSLASFHYAFASRDELLRRVIDTVIADERAATERILATGGTLHELLRGGLAAYLTLLRANPHHEQAMLELTFYALRTPSLRGLAAKQYGSYESLAAGLLGAAARHTGTRWTLPLGDVARLAIALTDGMTTTWLADRNDAGADRLADVAADLLASLAADDEP